MKKNNKMPLWLLITLCAVISTIAFNALLLLIVGESHRTTITGALNRWWITFKDKIGL